MEQLIKVYELVKRTWTPVKVKITSGVSFHGQVPIGEPIEGMITQNRGLIWFRTNKPIGSRVLGRDDYEYELLIDSGFIRLCEMKLVSMEQTIKGA